MLLAFLLLWLQAVATPASQSSALARQHLKHGHELSQKGDLKSAESELRQAVKLAPNDAVGLALLGMVLFRQEKLAEANGYFEKALELDPSDSGTRYNLAVNCYRLNRPEKAREALTGFLDHPATPETVFQGAKAASYAGDLDTAEKLLESIRSTYPDKVKLGYELALVQYNASRFDQSRSTLLWTIAGESRDVRLYRLLAWTYQRQERPTEATRTMMQAIELEPSAEAGYTELALVLIEQKRFTDAYEVAAKAVEKMPNSGPVHKVKGQAESYIGIMRQALGSFQRAVELDPTDQEALLLMAQVQANLRMVPEASATFEKGIAKFPRSARFYESYGRLLLQPAGKPDAVMESRAQSLLEKALALDNSLADAHYELGKLLLAKGRAQEALPHLEASAKLKPAHSQFHFTLAEAYRALDREEDYRNTLEIYRKLQAEEQN